MRALLARSLAPPRPQRCPSAWASRYLTATSFSLSVSSLLLPSTRPRPKPVHRFVQQAQPARKQTASQTRHQTSTHYNRTATAITPSIGRESVAGPARLFSTQSSAMFAPKRSLLLEKWKGKDKIIGNASTKPTITAKVCQRFKIQKILFNLSVNSRFSHSSNFSTRRLQCFQKIPLIAHVVQCGAVACKCGSIISTAGAWLP